MNPASAIPLRYVVAPAVAQLYEEDKEGFDAATDEPVMAKLSNENDMVSGQESIYGYILNKHAAAQPTLDSVDGSEGFFGGIKKGASALIKAVKDFFKWIWSFFGSKQKVAANKAEGISKALDKNGAKDGDIPYPAHTSQIYMKTGKPDPNIAWVAGAIDNIAKTIDKTVKYAELLQGMAKNTGEYLTKVEGGEKKFGELNNDFNKELGQTFGVTSNKTLSLLSVNDMVYQDGRFSWRGNIQAIRSFQGAKFHTSTSELQGYVTSYNALNKKLGAMMTKIHELEDGIVRTLENHLIVANRLNSKDEANKKVIADTKTIVRSAMANIKTLQTLIFRTSNIVLDIIKVATK